MEDELLKELAARNIPSRMSPGRGRPSWATVKHAAFLKHSRGEHVAETADWYPVKVEAILRRSFPGPGGADAFWEMVAADIGGDRIGIVATATAASGSPSRW